MTSPAGPAVARPTGSSPIVEWLGEHGEGLIALRRNLHAHPELSGQERATTDLVSERLELAGLEPRRLAVGTGLVCDIVPESAVASEGFSAGLALRADLDALAMADEKDVAYRSQVSGVSHACGHDVHTTIVLGTALANSRQGMLDDVKAAPEDPAAFARWRVEIVGLYEQWIDRLTRR